jgi:hypothetical protein
VGRLRGADEVDSVFALLLHFIIQSLSFMPFLIAVLGLVCDREVDVCLRGPDGWCLGFWCGGGWRDLDDFGHETAVEEVEGLEEERREEYMKSDKQGAVCSTEHFKGIVVGDIR